MQTLREKIDGLRAVYNPMIAEMGDTRLIRNAVIEQIVQLLDAHVAESEGRFEEWWKQQGKRGSVNYEDATGVFAMELSAYTESVWQAAIATIAGK